MEDLTISKIPDAVIKKHGLVDNGATICASFVNNARIFEFPEVADVYLMECGADGNPIPKKRAMLFARKLNKEVTSVLTHEFLEDCSHEYLLHYINHVFD